jgi:hypothetical protein
MTAGNKGYVRTLKLYESGPHLHAAGLLAGGCLVDPICERDRK